MSEPDVDVFVFDLFGVVISFDKIPMRFVVSTG